MNCTSLARIANPVRLFPAFGQGTIYTFHFD
jgi:hypothetical protein